MHVSWGAIGDHDTWQEHKLRWMETNLRNLVAPLIVIVTKPCYKGKFSFIPFPLTEEERKRGHYRDTTIYPISKEKGFPWREIDDEFFFIVGVNLRQIASDVIFSPGCKPCEGAIDIGIVMSNVSRFALVKIFLQMETGVHVQNKDFDCMKVTEFIIEPKTPGLMSFSGELTPSSPFHVISHKGAASFIY